MNDEKKDYDDDELQNLISKKANFYKYQNVHLKLKSGQWENGFISEVGADFLILILNEKGKQFRGVDKMPVFFLEIRDIEEYVRGVD